LAAVVPLVAVARAPTALAGARLAGTFAAVVLLAPVRLPSARVVAGFTTAEAAGRVLAGPVLRLGVTAAFFLGDVARFIGLLALSGGRTDPA